MPNVAYTPDRLRRCLAKYIQWRTFATRHPEACGARALARYWEREARKAAEHE